jgi:hypothetical protein
MIADGYGAWGRADWLKGDGRTHMVRLGNKLKELLDWAERELKENGHPLSPENKLQCAREIVLWLMKRHDEIEEEETFQTV